MGWDGDGYGDVILSLSFLFFFCVWCLESKGWVGLYD